MKHSTMRQNAPRSFYGRDITDIVRTPAGYQMQNKKENKTINLSLHDIQTILWNFKFVRDNLGFTTARCINFAESSIIDLGYGEWDDEEAIEDDTE